MRNLNTFILSPLINIINLSLWEKPFDETSLLSLTYDEWKNLLHEACIQGVSAIFIDGLDKLKLKNTACKELLSEKGIQIIISTENRWLGQLKVATTIAKTFRNNGIRMLLLKGLGLSLCYPEPKLRECGDIDIYLFGDYEKGNRIAEQYLGAKVEKFSKKEDHIILDGFSIDNHINFLWTANNKNSEINQYLKGLLESECMTSFPDTVILIPPTDFNFLFLLTHSYSHFMREGLSLRQMVDIACFLTKNESQLDWNNNIHVLQRFGLKRYADAVIAFTKQYFGLDYTYVPDVETSLLERMMNDIIGKRHSVIYHHTRIGSKIYMAKTSWINKWRYDAFYQGGYKQFVIDSLKKQLNFL